MSEDPLIGQQLDEYRIEALLGQGGMARVYRGLDTRLDRWVAIKVIEASFQNDIDYIARFEREAKAIAQLEHPHIVSVYRYGEVDGLLYMAMQYIQGSSLDRMLTTYHREGDLIPIAEARRIIEQTCLALDYAHNRGVIHRDVKPANIMIDKQGNAYLADFGLVLLTDVGTRGEIFGTPHYIAPEQAISSAGAVPQSDLYAVGVILFEMFTGQVPFDADSAMDVAMMHMTEPPPPPRAFGRPDLSPEVEAVILKALEKEPAGRYPNGAALVAALDQALKAGVQVSLPLPPSHKSILQRVAVDIAERPLPPLPAGVSPPPPQAPGASVAASLPLTPAGVDKPASSPNRSLLLAGLGIGTLVIAGFIVLALVALLFFGLQSGDQESASPPVEPTATAIAPTGVVIGAVEATSAPPIAPSAILPQATASSPEPVEATSAPSVIPSPTLPQAAASSPEPPEEPEATPTPSASLTTHQLLIATRGEDSMMIINRGDQPLPLANLELSGEKGEITGGSWGNIQLEPGDCVTLLKNKGKPKRPDEDCHEVGGYELDPKQVFWKDRFNVYFAGQQIARCNDDRCQATFAVTQNQNSLQVETNNQNDEGDDEGDD